LMACEVPAVETAVSAVDITAGNATHVILRQG
jgi:hypothetical protein